MNKLKIEHLSAYLPYKVQMTRNGFIGELLSIKTPKEDSLVSYYEFQVSCSTWWENNTDDLNPYKLIFRPLSDLTKEIECNGEEFVPTKVLSVWDLEGMTIIDIPHIPVNMYGLLLKWHFDVFGLIEAGLAVDINTLKK